MNQPLLARWILSTLGLTFSLSSQELDQVLIQVPPAQQSSTLQFSYFLTGPFGGYGAVGELPTTLEHPVAEIPIPIYQNEHRAQSLKAVVYAKGCELARFTWDPLPLGSSRVPFVCRDLPTLRLRGRILGYPESFTLTVQFTYVATWSHTFFGYLDGATLITLPIADAQPNAGGEFEVQVPDFSKDLATRSYPGLAYWSINARK
ncbi:MAG: hypothetical protein J0H49_00290 [Acidobacteria bacterium]|nr:hypothetical protein [Acidobacteriota bacterium]